jgi:pimeloyl-ACP methyl ester carboxylesterase
MAHVTFVHGIANKPPAEDLLRIWCRALADAAEPVALGDQGITSSLVYWADLMYDKPDEDLAAHEGVLENTPAAVDGAGDAPPPVPENAEQAAFIEGLRRKLTTLDDAQLASAAPPPAQIPNGQGALERIPLPWFIKRRFMNAFLRDVHHYLFDIEHGPAGRTPVPIRKTIRQRFIDAVCAPTISRPHVVVSHSMGTVIAYDCLKQVDGCAGVDGLITIGSPLGLDEVQDKLKPGWSRADGFPGDRVAGKWVNLFDRLDPVCGFDPRLANDYRRAGARHVEDIAVQNDGAWRHSGTKYLRQPQFCGALRAMLEG